MNEETELELSSWTEYVLNADNLVIYKHVTQLVHNAALHSDL